jgi:2-keto-4-pentenoate hydratase/2-oxohepta-3-ene-1,7-dioic acid hydratase in catechol pathway
VGANYLGHLKEMGLDAVPKWDPMLFFNKPPTTTLVGPGKTVEIPKMTKNFDWELELTMVVGKQLKNATPEEALQAIAGYTICLDMSCRDLTKVDLPIPFDMTRTKLHDTMAPCGPHIVPAQFIPDVDNLRMQLFVNDDKMQDGNTSEMIYSCHEMLSTISQVMTLEPGDLVLTGTFEGCAAHRGNRWLKPGDRIRAEIEGIGVLNVSMMDA